MTKLAILHSTIRKEEKRIHQAAMDRNLDVLWLDIRRQVLDPETFEPAFDVALERSVSTVKGNHIVDFLEAMGVTVINSSTTARICGDKFLTSLLLQKSKIPTARFAMAFNTEQAAEAVEQLGGYPVVLKPPSGSWGRLLAKINDRDALEALLEHKDVLGSPPHKAFYLQEYVPKSGRDIRAFVVGPEVICAVYRESLHWITNTARGARTTNCPVTPDLQKICMNAARVAGGGLLAIDLFETEDGLKINEINHTMEFRNSEKPTGTDIAGAIVDYCVHFTLASKTKEN